MKKIDLTEIFAMAEDGEEIPYYVIYSNKPGTVKQSHIDWAQKSIRDRMNRDSCATEGVR